MESSFVSAFRVLTKIPLYPFDRFESIHKIERVKCPILFIHGTKDGLIPSWHSEKLFEKATSAARDKKTDNAIKLFKQIVESDPKDFVVWTDFGTLYFRGDKFSEAEKCYLTALEHKPDFMLAQLNLSRLYLTQKQPEKVIQILTKALETQPNSADANHYLGEAYLQAKLGSKAIIYLNAAIQLAPIEKAELHLRLGWLYNAAGLKDRAALEYKQFLAKVPKYAEKEKLEKYINENLPPQ